MSPDQLSATADVVTATAAIGTLVVAVVAALYAKRQVESARGSLEEARALRREQAQPYVIVSLEASLASPRLIDLVIKNLGTTAAFDVQLTSDPALTRVKQDEYVQVWPGYTIPTLVPGQEVEDALGLFVGAERRRAAASRQVPRDVAVQGLARL